MFLTDALYEPYLYEIALVFVSAVAAYAMFYIKKLTENNEKFSVVSAMLNDKVDKILKEIELSLKEKTADGVLTLEEKEQLKLEVLEILKSRGKEFGLDLVPSLYPSLVTIIMERMLKK